MHEFAGEKHWSGGKRQDLLVECSGIVRAIMVQNFHARHAAMITSVAAHEIAPTLKGIAVV
jgi:hypothetical protein